MKRFLLSFLIFLSVFSVAQTQHYGVEDGLLNNQIRQLISMPNHQIFVITEGAFFLFNGRYFIEQPCRRDSIKALPGFGFHDYMWQGDSILWLKDFYNLYRYNAHRRCFTYDYPTPLPHSPLYNFIHANADSVVSKKRVRLSAHQFILDSIMGGRGFSDYHLAAYETDWQGGEWFGLESDGIIYRKKTDNVARPVPLTLDDDTRFVRGIDETQLLIAGAKGIYLYDTATSLATPLTTELTECTNLCPDAQGGVWISSMQGLHYYKNEQVNSITPTQSDGFLHSHIRFAVPIPGNRLLVCNILHHLGYYDISTRHFDCLNNRLPQLNNYRVMIDALPYDKKGTMLVITQNGLFLLDTHTDKLNPLPESNEIARFTTKYNCALHDNKGTIWLGTQNGLFWLVPKLNSNGVVTGYSLHRTTTSDGMSNNCIRSITEDTQGNIWVGTSYGINCIKMTQNSLRIVPLLKTDGVPDVEMFERGVCATQDGKVYFTSQMGLTVIDSRTQKESRDTYAIFAMMLKAHAKQLPLDRKTYQLAYNDFPLEMEFSALNYASPEHTHYRYKMKGVHSEWQYDNSGKGMASITLNTLSPGTYTFDIQATLDNGNWGPVLSIQFTVSPPWWWSWWAIALYILFVATLSTYAISRYLKYRRQQLEHENEAKVNKLFELQIEAHHNFAQNVQMETKKLEGQHEQSNLAGRMTQSIASNMDNVDYTVDAMARELGMSRASLYNKVQNELGITPSDFIRNIRLKHAVHLLEQGIPVNQVSLMVGFQTPYYFSKCFKKMFGVTPSRFHDLSRTQSPIKEDF